MTLVITRAAQATPAIPAFSSPSTAGGHSSAGTGLHCSLPPGAALLLFLVVRHFQHNPPRSASGGPGHGMQNGPVAVSVATAASGDIQLRIPALGTVTPLATVTVRTQITGIMQKILFTEGQTVHQGDSLAQIDARPYEAALQQMQGNLQRDQALLADAELDLKRYDGLVKEDSIAEQQLD